MMMRNETTKQGMRKPGNNIVAYDNSLRSDACDGAHCVGDPWNQRAFRLDTGNNSGLFPCKSCWEYEMAWRIGRNRRLKPQNYFDIKPFPED